eukprot:6483505-Amphidinium_carterae.1
MESHPKHLKTKNPKQARLRRLKSHRSASFHFTSLHSLPLVTHTHLHPPRVPTMWTYVALPHFRHVPSVPSPVVTFHSFTFPFHVYTRSQKQLKTKNPKKTNCAALKN